jgi:hypothetical protein
VRLAPAQAAAGLRSMSMPAFHEVWSQSLVSVMQAM